MGIVTLFLLARQDCLHKRVLKDAKNGNIIITGSRENERGHTDGSGSTYSTVVKSQAPNQADLGRMSCFSTDQRCQVT